MLLYGPYVNMYDNTRHCINNSTLCCAVFFFCVCFFAWLADRIWKISGRKTDSLINMALYTNQITHMCIQGDHIRLTSVTGYWSDISHPLSCISCFLIPDHISRPFAAIRYSRVFWHFMYKFISVVVNTINLQMCFEQWLSSRVL